MARTTHWLVLHDEPPSRDYIPVGCKRFSTRALMNALKNRRATIVFDTKPFELIEPFPKLIYMLGFYQPVWGETSLKLLLAEYSDILEKTGIALDTARLAQSLVSPNPKIVIELPQGFPPIYERWRSFNSYLRLYPSYNFYVDLVRAVVRSPRVSITSIDTQRADAIMFPSFVHVAPPDGLLIARFDPRACFWTLFHPLHGGSIFRCRLDQDQLKLTTVESRARSVYGNYHDPTIAPHPSPDEIFTSTTPEWVAVRIASGTLRRYASFEKIARCAEQLAHANTFEVALIGEPTKHPYFIRVLELFIVRGILPHFITSNYQFISRPENLKRLATLFGHYAVRIEPASSDWRTIIKSTINAYKAVSEESDPRSFARWRATTFWAPFPILDHQLYFHIGLDGLSYNLLEEVVRFMLHTAYVENLPLRLTLVGNNLSETEYQGWFRFIETLYAQLNEDYDYAPLKPPDAMLSIAFYVPDIPTEGRNGCHIDLITDTFELFPSSTRRRNAPIYSADWTSKFFMHCYTELQAAAGLRDKALNPWLSSKTDFPPVPDRRIGEA